MSLHTDYTTAPKVVTIGRTVRYAAEPTSWADSAGNTVDLFWTVRRVSSMAFNILALTQSAAEAGAAALQREYTRKYARWTAETDTSQSPPSVRVLKSNALLCTSSITPRLAQGSIWHIEATIDEEDTIVADHEPTYDEFEELFALAFAREEADDGGASFVIDEAHWDSTTGRITMFWSAANIDGFTAANVTVQIHRGTWQAATVVPGSMGAGGCQIESAANAAVRAVYNLGQSDEVATAPYRTNDPELPAITLLPATYTDGPAVKLTFSVAGSPAALANVADISRWRVQLYSGSTLLHSDTNRVGQLRNIGGGSYEADFSPSGDAQLRSWFNAAGGMLNVSLAYLTRDASSVANSTITRANYVDLQSVEVVDAIPNAVRMRMVFASDLDTSIIEGGTMSIVATIQKPGAGSYNSTGVIDRIVQVDPNSNPPRFAAMVRFNNIPWQLSDVYATISGSFSAAAYGIGANFSAAAPFKFPLCVITGAQYDDAANKTNLTMFAWDVDANWMLSLLDWSYQDGDTWSTFYPTPSASSVAPNFAGYADGDVAFAPIRAQAVGTDILYFPASAQYLRILGVAVADTAATAVVDWRINGLTTLAALEACTFEVYVDGDMVANADDVDVRGDTLAFTLADVSPGNHEIQIMAKHDLDFVYSVPFTFTVAGGAS